MKADKKAIVTIQKVIKNQIDDGCRLGSCATCPIKMYNIVFTKDKIMKSCCALTAEAQCKKLGLEIKQGLIRNGSVDCFPFARWFYELKLYRKVKI
jgi:hypothetical protein